MERSKYPANFNLCDFVVTLLKNTTGVDSSEGNHDVLGKSEPPTFRHGVASGQAAHQTQPHDWGTIPQIPAIMTAVANARLSSSPVLLPSVAAGIHHQMTASDPVPDGVHSHPRIPSVPIPPAPAAWDLIQAQSLYAAGIQQPPPYMPPDFTPYQLPQIPTLPLNTDFMKATSFLDSLSAAVDFSLPPRSTQSPRNGNNPPTTQNGESTPVSPSLSVRDVKQINSLAERRQVFADLKRPKRFDSILERLSTTSVIVSAAHSSHDDNSNSSPAVTAEDEVLSNASNEDSIDGAKSRRKRKPSKTVRLSKDDENLLNLSKPAEEEKLPEKIEEPVPPPPRIPTPKAMEEDGPEKAPPPVIDEEIVNKTRRRTLSETETIENIAAMIASTEDDKMDIDKPPSPEVPPIAENLENVLGSPPVEAEPPSIPPVLNQPEPTKSFVEVENELEKMFAGLEENGEAQPNPAGERERVTSTSSDLVETPKPTRKKINKPKKLAGKLTKLDVKKKPIKPKEVVIASDSGSNTSSIKSKGPFIQIRGPRDSPLSVNIINAPTIDADDSDKTPRTKLSKKSFHDDSEYRTKVRSKGLHCSTLSIKYDAHTTDTTWICVFCKRGPHTNASDITTPSTSSFTTTYSSGDLFGPYLISSDCPEYQESIEELNADPLAIVAEPYTGKFFNKRAKKKHLLQQNHWSLEADPLSSESPPRREHSAAAFEGMIESSEQPNRYEIWAHEDCIVWCPGVYLAGPRIVGLEAAVWSCCSAKCEHCGKRGASVACLTRNCGRVAHVGCAKLSNWCLDEDTYKAFCQRHKKVT